MTEYSQAKTGEYPRIFSNFQNYARCGKDLKDNKDNSRHLGRKFARKFVLGYYLFLVAHSLPRASLSENCSLLETDNVGRQISELIFAPNGDYCLFIPTFDLIWKLMRQMSLGIKFFLWEAKVSWTKQLDEKNKNKFIELCTEEIQQTTDNAIPVTTKKP